MNILFEEGGAFKTATVLDDLPGSYMAESISGKRVKIKKNQVFLIFNAPTASQLLELAQPIADSLDIDFLWDCAPEGEIDFRDFAADYFGKAAQTPEVAAMLLKLHAMPMFFCRRGKGMFQRAQEDNLRAALAGLEKKRRIQLAIDELKKAMTSGQLPEIIAERTAALLYRPDKNSLEYKAIDAVCQEKKTSPVALLHELGAIPSHYHYHLNRFLFDYFPQGTDFPECHLESVSLDDLPLARVSAFSIDDETTVEFDDAFSVDWLDDMSVRIGVHIAVPTLFFSPGSDIDGLARKRLSTVYMPGDRITMLPEIVVSASSLVAGRCCPVLSYYRSLELSPDGGFVFIEDETLLERISISDNLSASEVEANLEVMDKLETIDAQMRSNPIVLLYEVAKSLLSARLEKTGKPQLNERIDFNFYVVDGRIRITERKRGNPLDTLVSEMMIMLNSRWANWLKDAETAAIYRTQAVTKVKMTTVPAAHSVLGLDCYGWSSSPLRRYVDLVNQWQLLSLVRGVPAPFAHQDERLFSAITDFDLAYAAYNDFQYQIERYWCLRWLEQEGKSTVSATVIKDQVVRIDGLPLTVKSKSLPIGITGQTVEVRIETIDFWENNLHVRYIASKAEASD